LAKSLPEPASGGVPARMRRRVGRRFAFGTYQRGTGFQGLLNGRSARLITTMDTPAGVHPLIY
jgi:putative NADPH-quinone reductase